MGAVEVSPFGGFRQRSVFGPAVRVKYSMHCGREKSEGRFNGVKDELSGGISDAIQICSAHCIFSLSEVHLTPRLQDQSSTSIKA